MAPKPTIIESPYSADTLEGIELNVFYAQRAMRDSYVNKNEAPVAPHLLYTNLTGSFVSDSDTKNRLMGREYALACCEALRRTVGKVIFYMDRGESSGMKIARDHCIREGISFEERRIPSWRETEEEWLEARRIKRVQARALENALTELDGLE